MQMLARDMILILGTAGLYMGFCNLFSPKATVSRWQIAATLALALCAGVAFSLAGISPLSGFHTDIRLKEINFIPFKGIRQVLGGGLNGYAVRNIAGNLLMLAPVGFFLPLLLKDCRGWHKVVLAGFATSLLIECTQLFLLRGTDVDDLMLNTLGALLGYLCYKAFSALLPAWSAQFTLDGRGARRLAPYACILLAYAVIFVCGLYDRSIYLA